MSKGFSNFRIDIFNAVKKELHPISFSLLTNWLPGGRLYGEGYWPLNPTRDDRHIGSFYIHISSGLWYDFATEEGGGDIISLYAYINHLSNFEAAKELAKKYCFKQDVNQLIRNK